jgi:subtilisin family serine protease
MRFTPLLLTLALVMSVPAHAGSARFVAQLAGAPGDAALARARAGTLAVQRAAPRLAALGLAISRGLLDGLPASLAARPARAGEALALRAFAPERVVLLEARDEASAEAARTALVDEGVADWVEPLAVREIQLESYSAVMGARPGASASPWPARLALLDTLPNDPYVRDTKQWGIWNVGASGFFGGIPRADVHAAEGWALCVGSDALKLAVADTGIDPAQPELGGTLVGGGQRIVDALNVTDEPVPAVTDSAGHGTPVAGVMAARTNDGPHFSGGGVAGMCGGDGVTTAGCRIVPIKIAPGHSGEATSFDIARAMIHATDVGARAMNLSFAGPGSARIERLALTYAITRGCVVVVAAGNKGASAPTQPQYPSAYAAEGLCIQAGASDPFDQRVNFSSYGPGLDLMAPGVNDYTTFMTYPSYYGAVYDGYVAASGTSFAAPFVAGAVGLLATARPELIDTDFQRILRETADDIGAPGVDAETGWGRLNVGSALHAVRPEVGIWHDEVRADSLVADGEGTLAVGESGPGTLDRFRGNVAVTRWAVYATVTVPDSLVDSLHVWPRVGGTLAVRGDYRLPYFASTAEVVAQDARTFTLRGWLYRADEDTTLDGWIPLPPEYVRFGFTVIGRAGRSLPAGGTPVANVSPAAAPMLRAGPNPFRGALDIVASAPGRVGVYDAGGRLVRALESRDGHARWDGRDAAGRDARPGLYFVRWTGGARTRTVRVVRLPG